MTRRRDMRETIRRDAVSRTSPTTSWLAGFRLGVDVLLPLVEHRTESLRDLGALSNHVGALAEVRAHVVQHRAAVVEKQLPVAGANCFLLSRSAHTPEQRSLDEWSALRENWKDVHPLELRF